MCDDQERDDPAATPDAIDEHDRTPVTNAASAGVRAAMEAAGSPFSEVFNASIRRAADNSLGAAGIGAWASPASHPRGEIFDFGVSSAARAASDALNEAITRRGDDILGGQGFAGIIGARDFVSPMDYFKDFHGPHLGLGLRAGAQAAIDIFGTRESMYDMLGQYGVDHLRGISSTLNATLAGSSRWDVGDLLGGHATGVADQLRQAALGGYTSPFDEMMRRSHHSIHDFMYGSSRFPEPTAWMNDVLRELTESVEDMMRSLWPLADRGMRAAQSALRAALRIARMLERNDPKAREAVQKFLVEWIDFSYATSDLVCSATLVLMNVGSWLPTNMMVGSFDPRPRLRALTLKEHRAVGRLSTDPKLRFPGKPLLSLDQPVKVSDVESSVTVLRDVVPDRAAPDPADVDDADMADPRIARLWWRFTDREREILREKSKPRVTWPAAAIACGGTAAEGDRLRRKARRLARADESSDAPTRRATEAS